MSRTPAVTPALRVAATSTRRRWAYRCVPAAAAGAALLLAGCGINTDVATAKETSGAQVVNATVDHSDLFLRGVYIQPDAGAGGAVVAATIVASAKSKGDRLTGVKTPVASRVVPTRSGASSASSSPSPSGSAMSPRPSGSKSPSPSAKTKPSAKFNPSARPTGGSTPSSGASASASPSGKPSPSAAGSPLPAKSLRVAPLTTLHFVDPTVASGGGVVLRIVGLHHPLRNGTAVPVTFTFADAGSQTVQAPIVADPGTTGVHARNGAE
jgi:copper(I)-binding protein